MFFLKCPYYGFLKITFMQCVKQLYVNENILQSFKSESTPCLKLVGLIYQSNVETSADPSAQINLRQSSRVIYETFVWRQSHCTKDRTLINVAAENNRRLNITPGKTPRFRSLAPKVYDKE